MEFRILGALEIRDRRGQLLALGGHKQRALLAVLLLNANQLVAAGRLIDELWTGENAESARRNLHLAVYRLRRVLAGDGDEDRLRTHSGGYLLQVAAGELDSDRFTELIQQARAEAAAGRPAPAVASYDAALGLWRGQPLSEFSGAAFAQPAIARLEELHLAAATERAEAVLQLGRHTELVPALEELTRRYPLQERLYRLLILALYRSGRQADALAVFHAARQRLTEQLGLEPSEELQRLQRAILNQDPMLATPPGVLNGQATAATRTQPPPAPPGEVGATTARDAPSEPAKGPPAPPVELAATSPGVSSGAEVEVRQRPDAASAEPAAAERVERRTVTVLAARIQPAEQGGAALGDPDDPEELWTRHDPVVGVLREQVERLGGVVHTDLGETLIATFGARRGHADDPARAVRAALAAGEALTGQVAASIGIDTGTAVVALAGTEAAPRVTGEVLRVAAGLAAAAPAGAILVGETTVRATDQVVEYQPSAVEGRQRAWQVVGLESGETPVVEPAPMVGRERELTLLSELLDRARTELDPQLVTVVGAPGVGKTRLLQELRARVLATPDPPAWLEGHSPPYGDGVTFWALAEIVKTSIDILATDTAEEARRKLNQAVSRLLEDAPEALWITEYLEPLISPRPSAESPVARRREAFLAWRSFLEAMANQRPLVLILDDLHWADDALLDFIEHLADHSEAVPLLIVCIAWPELLERRPGWGGGKRNATTISLGPLSDAHTARLLDRLLDRDGRGQPLEETLRAQLLIGSGGNPLFVEEYVRMLRGRAGGATPGRLAPPETVQLLIGARLDDLEAEDRALLAGASVLGDTLWDGALAAITDRDPAGVTAALRRLARRDFLRRVPRSSIPGQVEYAFRHGLIREVAYGRLLRGDRARRHQRAAEWLEALGADRVGERAELIAYHYREAVGYLRAARRPSGDGLLDDLTERAARALRQAAGRAVALAAYPAALRYYDQALDLWPEDLPGRLELLLAREELCFRLEHDADANVVLEARDGLLAAGNHVGAATAQTLLAQLTWLRGRVELAAEQERRAHELARAAPPSRGKARVLATIGFNLCTMSRFAEALEVGREALALARPLRLRRTEAAALGVVGLSRAVLGDRDGVDDARRSVTALEELRAAHTSAAYGMLGAVLSYLGDLEGMSRALADTRRTTARFDTKVMLVWMDAVHVGELYWAGRWDEAAALADRQIGRFGHGVGRYVEVWCRCMRAKVRLARGDADGALDDAVVALEIARHADEHTLLPAAALRGFLLTLGIGTEGDEVSGRPREDPAALAKDLRSRLAGHLLPPFTGVELAELLVVHGTPPEAVPDRLAAASLWLGALRAYLTGEPGQAADIYVRIGSRPDEALARLLGAQRLAAAGRTAEAAEQLRRAEPFYAEVRATRYLELIKHLRQRNGLA